MTNSAQVTPNSTVIIKPDIIITTTMTSISNTTNTTSNLILSKLTLDSHIPNLQLKLPQVLTLINPPIKSNITINIPHNTTPNTST